MNILILQQSMGIGGVNVVSAVLARKFRKEGHRVLVFYFSRGRDDMRRELYEDIPLIEGDGFNVTKKNVEILSNIIEEYSIDLIINHWGLPYVPTAVLKKACKKTGVKWVSYYHNDPFFNGRIHEIELSVKNTSNIMKLIVYRMKQKAMKKITGLMMAHNYQACWRFVVLADCYRDRFKRFTGVKNVSKLLVMNNPVTVDSEGFVFDSKKKQKELIFVGRLDPISKRVSRLVEAWSIIEPKYPDWKLTIVGEGSERQKIECVINEKSLRHVTLEGLQTPRPYYERASLLGMTSDFEGWPLVLGECMTFGVVPVVYGAFDAVRDIVEDGKNGVIVPKEGGGYSSRKMAESIMKLMGDDLKRESMMKQAIEQSKKFSIDAIYEKWNKVFEDLKNERKS